MIEKKLLYIYASSLFMGITAFSINPHPMVIGAFTLIALPIIAGYISHILYLKRPSRKKHIVLVSYLFIFTFFIIVIGQITKILNLYHESFIIYSLMVYLIALFVKH